MFKILNVKTQASSTLYRCNLALIGEAALEMFGNNGYIIQLFHACLVNSQNLHVAKHYSWRYILRAISSMQAN